MLSHHNPIDIEIALRKTEPTPPFPPIDDRAAWHGVRQRLGEDAVTTIIQQAEEDASAEIPFLRATLFLDFDRTGRREGYEDAQSRRQRMLASLTIAECLEDQGRFLDPLLDVAWAICEESTWCYPAHHEQLIDIHRPYLDLGAAMLALTLAEMDHLVGSRLDPRLGKRIRDEVNQRCIAPYLERNDHWWLYKHQGRRVNNWTAVCNSGIVGAALYLESDPARLAAVLGRAARSLEQYLDTFDPDGGSTEGPGYWGYGFGYYVMLAHLVEQRTGGEVSFLEGERLRKIAAFPLRTLLRRGVYVNFSDCDADAVLGAGLLHYLANRLDLADLHGLALQQPKPSDHHRYLNWWLRDLFWTPPDKVQPDDAPPRFAPASHDWYSGMMWMIARMEPTDSDALVLAVKGGHNNEMHNQNDVGNLIVHVNGESLIADVGRGRYTKEYFLEEERYGYFVNSSLGHSVPVPNGQLQQAGEAYAAELLEHHANIRDDTLHLELKNAYPSNAKLSSLCRRVTLHREAPSGWIELVDDVEFADAPGMLESAFTTFNEVAVGENAVIINGHGGKSRGKLRIGFDPETVVARVDIHHEIDFPNGPLDVNRIVFAFKESTVQGALRLEFVPV